MYFLAKITLIIVICFCLAQVFSFKVHYETPLYWNGTNILITEEGIPLNMTSNESLCSDYGCIALSMNGYNLIQEISNDTETTRFGNYYGNWSTKINETIYSMNFVNGALSWLENEENTNQPLESYFSNNTHNYTLPFLPDVDEYKEYCTESMMLVVRDAILDLEKSRIKMENVLLKLNKTRNCTKHNCECRCR